MWWFEDCSILVYQYGSNICHSQMQGCNRQVLPTTKPPFFCRVQSQTPCHHSCLRGHKRQAALDLSGPARVQAQQPQDARLPCVTYTRIRFFLYLGPIYLFLFIVSCGIWDHSSPTRYRTHNPCSGTQSLNYQTTKESSESGELAFIKSAGVKKKKKRVLGLSEICWVYAIYFGPLKRMVPSFFPSTEI